MRLKHVLSRLEAPAKASLVWSRITFSRLTTVYFTLACVHCVIQVILQIRAFSMNAAAVNTLWSRMQVDNQTWENHGFAILGDDLRICWRVPNSISVDSCQVIWRASNHSSPSHGLAAESSAPSPDLVSTSQVNGAVATPGSAPTASPATYTTSPSSTSQATTSIISTLSPISTSTTTRVIATPVANAGANPTTIVIANINDNYEYHDRDHPSHSFEQRSTMFTRTDVRQLSDTCVKALIWPVQKLSNTKREDITFIGFQFWVLGMSVVALLNESIPHIIAALVTHLLVTTWSIYQIFETEHFRGQFAELITNGACKPNNMLGNYWSKRRDAEIPSAMLNSAVLLASAFLTYKLVKIYGWQTFKRVGASLTINRIYRLVLSLSISIQLALFFIVSAMALWIDQLCNGNIGRLAANREVYKIIFIIVFFLLIPWLSLGWFAVRREDRRMALAFLVLSLLFIGLWGAMFDSRAFRWTFVYWDFFTVMAITAGVLIVSTFILGLACRLNFGKGLPHYLKAEEPLDGDNFTPVYLEKMDIGDRDPEKVEFPSFSERSVPTFSAAFGRGPEVPKPAQKRAGSERVSGVGMYDCLPQEHQSWQRHAMSRSVSSTSSSSRRSEISLERNNTSTSHKTSASTGSGRSDVIGKRWVIE